MDVMISFSSHERHVARLVARGLEAYELEVWYDEKLGGQELSSEIRERIRAASVVVSLISRSFIRSRWCLGELEEGLDKVVAARVDGMKPGEIPVPLRSLNVIDLSAWHGNLNHKGWLLLARRCCEISSGKEPRVSSNSAQSERDRDSIDEGHLSINNRGRIGNISNTNNGLQKAKMV